MVGKANMVEQARTASQMIAKRLYEAGCRHAFGIPGGEVLALVEALSEAGIAVHLAKHENCAGFMAEGVHHHDGAPAILFATIGPGLANAVNVIANAWQDRVPMIVLTGWVTALDSHTYTHQVFDHVKLCEPVTKAAFRVESKTAGVLADKAVAIATSDHPGPVLLDVPMDVQRETLKDWYAPVRQPLAAVVPAPGPALDTAMQWLASAERPLMIAGLEVLSQGSGERVATFCKDNQIPLITTYKAKGILPEDDPLSLGGFGLSPRADEIVMPLVRQSDCILLAGYDPMEMRTGWRDPWTSDAKVIELSAVANTHYMHQAAINFVCSIAGGLEGLADGDLEQPHWPDGEIAVTRQKLEEFYRRDEKWGPSAIVDEVRKALPRDGVITIDSGAHRILASQVWQSFVERGVLQSTGLCTMGTALPLAIGRKLAERGRAVLAFVGDGGLEMFLGELATARDFKLGLPVVVFVDHSLGLIEMKQRSSQMPTLAVDFDGTDFPAVAKALGGHGIMCADRASLNTAVGDALERDTFTLIAVPIGKRAYDGRI